jgi:TonB family protein
MGICFVSAMVIAAQMFNSVPPAGALPLLLQLQPSLKGYGDSPRISNISRLHISETASAKRLLKKVEPDYPSEAKATGVEGDVVFRIIIGVEGGVEEIHLRRGKPILIEAAAKAVSKWRYETYMLSGNPVEVETIATVRFRLPSKLQ